MDNLFYSDGEEDDKVSYLFFFIDFISTILYTNMKENETFWSGRKY